MKQSKEIPLDCTLILLGAVLSGLMIGLSDHGQAALSVTWDMMQLVAFNGLVSFLIARLVRSNFLAILGSVIITIMLIELWGLWSMERSTDKYVAEMGPRIATLALVYTLPMCVLGSIGFVRLARRPGERGQPLVSFVVTLFFQDKHQSTNTRLSIAPFIAFNSVYPKWSLFLFGVRRLAAALLPANRARSESGSKLPHSKLAGLPLSLSRKYCILTCGKSRGYL